MKGHLVHVEYPTPVTMGAKKELMSELHELPRLGINLLHRTRCLVGSLAINVVKLLHEAPDCSETSFNALGAKGIPEQRQCLQEDEHVFEAAPHLALNKDLHEQLILDGMDLPIGSSIVGPLFRLGAGLQTRQILLPLHKERVVHTELRCRTSE